MNAARQLGLPFPQEPGYEPEAYLRGPANAGALAWMDHTKAWPLGRLAVQGEAGVGKTHFLHLFADCHSATLLRAESLRLFMPLPNTPALAIDDADTIDDPRSLLHVLNVAAERQILVLLAGRTAPSHWGIKLADLESRLRAIPVAVIHPPDEAMLRDLLRALIAERQLVVPVRVQAYLLLHLPRTGGALREAVARLERLALAHGGQVTRAMAALAIADWPPPAVDARSMGSDRSGSRLLT